MFIFICYLRTEMRNSDIFKKFEYWNVMRLNYIFKCVTEKHWSDPKSFRCYGTTYLSINHSHLLQDSSDYCFIQILKAKTLIEEFISIKKVRTTSGVGIFNNFSSFSVNLFLFFHTYTWFYVSWIDVKLWFLVILEKDRIKKY